MRLTLSISTIFAVGLVLISRPGEAGVVQGRVASEDNAPLAGAKVQILPVVDPVASARLALSGRGCPEPVAVAVCDRQGRFRLDGIPDGMWRVRVEALGHVPMEHPLGPLVSTVRLTAARLVPDVGLKARASDTEGRPLAGARARLEPVSPPLRNHGWYRPASIAVAGAEGWLYLRRGRDESLWLTATAEGYAEPATRRLSGPVPSPVEIRFEKGAPLRLQMVNRSGRPLEDVALRAGRSSWFAALTAADGRAELWAPVRGSLPVEIADRAGNRKYAKLGPTGDGVETIVLPPPVHIVGRVVDSESGLGLEGAVVWRLGEPESFVLSGEGGRYELPAPRDRALSISAAAVGHVLGTVRVGATRIDRLELAPLALKAGAVVAGRVVDPAGRGVPAVAVTVAGHRSRHALADLGESAVETDEDGRFVLGPLDVERARWLRLVKAGFASAWWGFPTLRPRSSRRLGEIVLFPGRAVFGRVMDDQDQPLAQAEVRLLAGAEGAKEPYLQATRADDSGRFELESVPAGVFRLEARAPGLFPLEVPGVEVPPGEEPYDLGWLFVGTASALEGRVVDGGGFPVPDAVVTASFSSQDDPRRSSSSRADDDGRFSVRGLRPGSFVDLSARAEGYAVKELRGVEVPLEEPLAVVMDRAASVSGRVLDSLDKAIPRAVVVAAPERGENEAGGAAEVSPPPLVGATDEQGLFKVSGLEPGRWTISAQAGGYDTGQSEPFELAEGETADLGDLVLERGEKVEGRVISVDGEPLEGVRLKLVPSNEGPAAPAVLPASAVSDRSGHFSLEGVRADSYSLIADREGYLRKVEAIEVTAGSGSDWTVLVLEHGREIAGRVTDDHGSPLSHVRLTLERAVRREPAGTFEKGRFEGRSKTDGSFRIQGLPEGTYELRGEKAGFAPASLGHEIELTAGRVSALELRLSRGGRISGDLVGLDFEELADVEVNALSADGLLVEGVVDFNMRYRISRLGPGTWRVGGWSPASGKHGFFEVEIYPSQVIDAEHDLLFSPGEDRAIARSSNSRLLFNQGERHEEP